MISDAFPQLNRRLPPRVVLLGEMHIEDWRCYGKGNTTEKLLLKQLESVRSGPKLQRKTFALEGIQHFISKNQNILENVTWIKEVSITQCFCPLLRTDEDVKLKRNNVFMLKLVYSELHLFFNLKFIAAPQKCSKLQFPPTFVSAISGASSSVLN